LLQKAQGPANVEPPLAWLVSAIQHRGGTGVYAVIETGGKQYKVQEGQFVDVEKLPQAVGETIELDRVLLVSDDEQVQVGQPFIEDAKVLATVARQDKHRKVIIFKYRPRKRYRRTKGHRQPFTRLHIDKIVV
jgi:large subunit ribosomal protein L21